MGIGEYSCSMIESSEMMMMSSSGSGEDCANGTNGVRVGERDEESGMLPCRFFIQGYCGKGSRCRFYHPVIGKTSLIHVPPMPRGFGSNSKHLLQARKSPPFRQNVRHSQSCHAYSRRRRGSSSDTSLEYVNLSDGYEGDEAVYERKPSTSSTPGAFGDNNSFKNDDKRTKKSSFSPHNAHSSDKFEKYDSYDAPRRSFHGGAESYDPYDRYGKHEKYEKYAKGEKFEKFEKYAKNEKHEKFEKYGKNEKFDKFCAYDEYEEEMENVPVLNYRATRSENGLVTFEYETTDGFNGETNATLFTHIDWAEFLAPGCYPPPITTVPEMGVEKPKRGKDFLRHALPPKESNDSKERDKKMSAKQEFQQKVKMMAKGEDSPPQARSLDSFFKNFSDSDVVMANVEEAEKENRVNKDVKK